MNVETKLPPGPLVTVRILREKGHTVAVRINRHGSARYSVDGRRETDAYTMTRRYRHYGI